MRGCPDARPALDAIRPARPALLVVAVVGAVLARYVVGVAPQRATLPRSW
jgi:hypothetical protein